MKLDEYGTTLVEDYILQQGLNPVKLPVLLRPIKNIVYSNWFNFLGPVTKTMKFSDKSVHGLRSVEHQIVPYTARPALIVMQQLNWEWPVLLNENILQFC